MIMESKAPSAHSTPHDRVALYCNFSGPTYNKTTQIVRINLIFNNNISDASVRVQINTLQVGGLQQRPFIYERKDGGVVQMQKPTDSLLFKMNQVNGLALEIILEGVDFQTGQIKQTHLVVPVGISLKIEEGQKYHLFITSDQELNIHARLGKKQKLKP